MENIIELFEQGFNISEISNLTNISQEVIKATLCDAKYLSYYTNPEKAKLVKIAANEYVSGVDSLTKLSKKYQVTIESISKLVKHLGVLVINKHNISKFNENIFDTIDTEEKAY